MASAPQQPQLPMFYNDLMPLNTRDHLKFRNRMLDTAPWLSKQHVVPLTGDEFIQAARHFPVIFSSGDNPLPLALMGLNEGVNTFFDDDGKLIFDASAARAGASVTLRFEMDTLVILHTCPHPLNPAADYPMKPVQVEMLKSAPLSDDDYCKHFRPENARAFENNRLYHLGL